MTKAVNYISRYIAETKRCVLITEGDVLFIADIYLLLDHKSQETETLVSFAFTMQTNQYEQT